MRKLAHFWHAVKYQTYDLREDHFSYSGRPVIITQWLVTKPDLRVTTMSFAAAIPLFGDLICTDRRDYVYGVSAMVAWPQDITPPEPDYIIDVQELFWRMTPILLAQEPDANHRYHYIPDLDMVFSIFGLDEAAGRELCQPLYYCRSPWKALHGSEMDGTVVRKLLLRIAGDRCRGVTIPCADLLGDFWTEHRKPGYSGKDFGDFRMRWEKENSMT